MPGGIIGRVPVSAPPVVLALQPPHQLRQQRADADPVAANRTRPTLLR